MRITNDSESRGFVKVSVRESDGHLLFEPVQHHTLEKGDLFMVHATDDHDPLLGKGSVVYKAAEDWNNTTLSILVQVSASDALELSR
jgi:hypothetical protein